MLPRSWDIRNVTVAEAFMVGFSRQIQAPVPSTSHLKNSNYNRSIANFGMASFSSGAALTSGCADQCVRPLAGPPPTAAEKQPPGTGR